MEAAHHRKIELQAPEDFAYLVDNVRRAAADSVSAAFPPVVDAGGGGQPDDDDLHARVEGLVNEYIRRTFALAAPNLTINGLPVDPEPFWAGAGAAAERQAAAEPEMEPFDARKRQRVEDLAREEEDLLRDIALLKRRVPAAAVRARQQALAAVLAADDAAAAAWAAEAEGAEGAEDEEEAEAENADGPADGAASFAQAVAGLGRLKQATPATVARMERARVAADYAVAER